MNHQTLSKATAFVALACVLVAAEHGWAQRAQLSRIAPPADEAPTDAAPQAEAPTYYQPSIYRFSEFEQSEYSQYSTAAMEAVVEPPAPLASDEPAYGGGNYSGGNYGYSDCCCKLTGFVGAEATFLFPVLEDAPASVRILENGGPDPLYTTEEVELDDEIMYSPRIWAGVQKCGWGAVTRFWMLDGADTVFAPETVFFPQSHVAKSRIEAFTLDLEGFHKWTKGGCGCDDRYLSAGFRYASFEADELVEAHAVVGGDFVQGLAHTLRDFEGPGFTMAYGGSHRMVSAPAVQLYFNLRGSFLWADITKAAQTTAWAFDPSIVPGTAVNFSTAYAETSDAVFITEVQLGAQYEQPLQCCCGRFFLRAGIEHQYWTTNKGYAAAGSEAFTDGAIVTSLAEADDLELNLIGFTVGTGLLY